MLTTGHCGSDRAEVLDFLRNDPKKKWVVQKFGGTSVGKFADRVVDDVVKYICQVLKKQAVIDLESQTRTRGEPRCCGLFCTK